MQRLANAIVSKFHGNATLSAFQGYSTLTNGSGPFFELAPARTPLPYVTYGNVPGLPNNQGFSSIYGARSQIQFTVRGADLDVVMTNTEALCKVFDTTSSLSLAGGEICRKPVRIEEPRFMPAGIDENGSQIYAGIAQYRFAVQRTRGA